MRLVSPYVRGFLGVTLTLTGALIGAGAMMMHLGEGIDVSKLGLTAEPEPVTVVMQRHGGTIVAGEDDSRLSRSSSLANRGIDRVDLGGFRGSDKQWVQLMQCVRQRYAKYNVDIVDAPPAKGEYVLAMVGDKPHKLDLPETVGGLAPHNGTVISDAVVFVFQPRGARVDDLCQTTAHEIGHALGLDHTRLCSDVMSYESCGDKRFRDSHARCGEWEDRDCDDGSSHQSSDEVLARAVGYREGHEHDHEPEPARRRWPIAIARR